MFLRNKICLIAMCALLAVLASCGGQQPTAVETKPKTEAKSVITFENASLLKEISKIGVNFDRFYLSSDEKTITFVGEKSLAQFDFSTFETKTTYIFKEKGFFLDFSQDGKTLAQTFDNQSVELVNVQTGEKKEIKPKIGIFGGASFSADGNWLILQMEDKIGVAIWDIQKEGILSKLSGFETAAPIFSAKLSGDSKNIIWMAREKIQLQDIATGKLATAIRHEDFIMAYALSSKNVLATASGITTKDKQTTVISLFDGETGKKTGEIETKAMASSIDFSPDGSLMAYTVGGTLNVWSNGQSKTIFDAPGEEFAKVAFTRSGTSLVCIWPGNIVRVFATAK